MVIGEVAAGKLIGVSGARIAAEGRHPVVLLVDLMQVRIQSHKVTFSPLTDLYQGRIAQYSRITNLFVWSPWSGEECVLERCI